MITRKEMLEQLTEWIEEYRFIEGDKREEFHNQMGNDSPEFREKSATIGLIGSLNLIKEVFSYDSNNQTVEEAKRATVLLMLLTTFQERYEIRIIGS